MTRRPGRFPDNNEPPPYAVVRRSVTTSTVESSPRQSSTNNGLSTSAVVGTLLGVAAGAAAGAAITYGMMKHERSRAPRPEYDDMPAFQRRSTFPDHLPSEHRRGRFVELERTVEKIRYPEDDEYGSVADRHAPPPHVTRYSQASAAPRSREYDDVYDDTRSRHSSRFKLGRSSSVRARSEAAEERIPLERPPLMITDREHRSTAGSRYSAAPPRSTHRPTVDLDVERDSYVSARSHRTSTTLRPPPVPLPPPSQSEYVSRSRAGSRVTTIKVSGSHAMSFPPNASRTHSLASARKVPLPASGVGSSHAGYDDNNDDADSVAPSDSISCVGSRRHHRRSYY